MGALSPLHLVIILVIALLVIGPGKLPEVGSALGKSIREFRKAASDVQEAVKLDAPVAPTVPAPVAPAPVTPAPAVAVTTPAAAAPNTLAAAATPNELSEPAADHRAGQVGP
jgi:TatA/E family protein of Tat protein translocase